MTEDEEIFEKKFMGDGYRVFKNGWPDFLIFKDGKAKFVEVKGYGDQLSNGQIGVLQILTDIGLSCFIWNPEGGFIEFKDYLIKTKGKAKSETIKEMPVKIEDDYRLNLRFMKRQKYEEVKALANKLGIARTYLNGILRGKREPGFGLAKKISKEMGIPLSKLKPKLFKIIKEFLD